MAIVSVAPTPALRAARFADDEGLDADGLRRAAAAARALAAGALPRRARVLVDGSTRARQTARALGLGTLAGEAGIQVDPALRDLDVGTWRGRDLAEIALDDLHRWHEEPAMTPPGGESRIDLCARVEAWLADIGDAEHVIAVSHPAVVRAVLLHALSCPPEVFWRIDVAPLTATLLHRPASGGDPASTTPWTLTHACRPL
ncbi:histidine phosphatase family protein [Frankia sp. AgKG'84/4]